MRTATRVEVSLLIQYCIMSHYSILLPLKKYEVSKHIDSKFMRRLRKPKTMIAMVSVNTLANNHRYQVHSYVRKLLPILFFPVQTAALASEVKTRSLSWR